MPDALLALQIIAEQKILEAMQAGAFDNLPGAGKPLILEDLGHVPEELRMAYKILKNAGCVPEEIAQRKEIARLTEMLASCGDEKEKIAAMRKLRWLLDKTRLGARRNAMLEANDEY
ncbi:MAG: DUF1992 domain-containing protein, partial [Desulfovibrio sp.]|nr:DUF1992 domain-containing protein [Desulfovibrio sp.]